MFKFCVALRPQRPYGLLGTAKLLSSEHSASSVQCCFTSTETTRTIRDGEPRTATSTFTQLLSSEHSSSVQRCFTSTETTRTIRDGESIRPHRLSHSSEHSSSVQCCFTSTETVRTARDGEPRAATSTFTQLLSSVLLFSSMLLYVHRDRTVYCIVRHGEPRTVASTFAQLQSSVEDVPLVEFNMYLAFLLSCQVTVTVGDSGLF